LWENVTSSKKPEVHDILQRRQRTPQSRTQATHTQKTTGKVWTYVRFLKYACKQTLRLTDRQTN